MNLFRQSKTDLFLFVLASGTGLLWALVPAFAFIITLVAATVLGLWRSRSFREARRFLIIIFIVGFVVRMALAVGFHVSHYLAGWEGFVSGDDRLHTIKGWQLALKIKGDYYGKLLDLTSHGESPRHGITAFTYLLAAFYTLFGFHPLASKFINCYLGATLPVIIYCMTRTLFGTRQSRIAAFFTAFYPSLLRWSICNLKDIFIIWLLYGAMTLIILIARRKAGFLYWVALGVIMFALWHAQFLYFSALFLCLLVMFGNIVGFSRRALGWSIAALTAVICISAIAMSGIIKDFLSGLLWTVSRYQLGMARADISGYFIFPDWFEYLVQVGHIPFLLLPLIILKGIVIFLFAPFPWAIMNLNQLPAYPQVLLWYLVLALALIGFTRALAKRPRECAIVAVFLAISIPIWAITTGNIGAAFRHRDHFAPIVFIFAANALVSLFKTRSSGESI